MLAEGALQRCALCLAAEETPARPLLRCAACKRVCYCSKKCQARDWKQSHRRTCGRTQLVENADALMLLKVWAATHATTSRQDSDSEETLLLCETFLSLPHLMAASSSTDQQRRAAANVARLALACYYDTEQAVQEHLDEACEYLGRFQCNNFEVCDDQLFPVAFGTCPLGALLNHECWPNCVAMYDTAPDGTIAQVLRTLRDVKAGEELCVTYVDAALSTDARRATLQQKYGFACTCHRCTSLAWMDDVAAARERTAGPRVGRLDQWVHGRFSRLLAHGPRLSPGELLRLLDDSDAPSGEASTSSKRFVPSTMDSLFRLTASPLVCTDGIAIVQRELDAALAAQNYTAAVVPAMWVVMCYRFVYGPVHPLLSLHLLTLAKVVWNAGHAQLTVQVLAMGIEGLAITHGASSVLMAEARQLLLDAKRELA